MKLFFFWCVVNTFRKRYKLLASRQTALANYHREVQILVAIIENETNAHTYQTDSHAIHIPRQHQKQLKKKKLYFCTRKYKKFFLLTVKSDFIYEYSSERHITQRQQ